MYDWRCGEKHLRRYLQFVSRYSNGVELGILDGELADVAIQARTGTEEQLACERALTSSLPQSTK
jgi:hypothetical protein